MYNPAKLTECFAGLVGFEQSYNVDHPVIDADIAASSSGITVNSMHPLLTYDNIQAVAEQFSQINVRPWVSGGTYSKNNIVKSGADIFQSLIDGNTASTSITSAWRKTNLLSAYLRKVYSAAVVKMFSAVMTQKKIGEVGKSLLGNVSLFEGAGNISGRIVKNNRFVGFKISLKSPDVVARLHAIGMQVDTAQNPLIVYLFHSSSNLPLKTWPLNHSKSIQFEWHKITEELISFQDDTHGGGSYYLGYYEANLTGQAIKKDLVWTGTAPCSTCSEAIINQNIYQQRSRYITVQPFYVNAPVVGSLWDADQELYVNDSNFGMNLQISVQCDISAWVCRNSNVFTDVLSQQITVDLLSQMAFSLRENHIKRESAGLAAIALDNQENGQYGESKKLAKAIEAMSFDLSKVNSICLPCDNKNQVKLSSVWS